jgi:hypothetical protein
MINFENIGDLASQLFQYTDTEEHLVSVVANKEIVTEIMAELLNYEDVVLDSCIIDFDEEYNREYILSLSDDIHSDDWHVSVEKCYNESKDIYYSTEGYVLFHEDVNSKALIDMQRNEFMPLGEHDWFTVGKDEELEDSDDEELSENDIYDSESTYISKNDDGVPVGFTKNWSVSKNGVTCYSSYSHFTDDVDMLREIASEIGIEL